VSMVPSAPSSPAPASRSGKGVRDMSLRAEADK
jgi:hypothetical protein